MAALQLPDPVALAEHIAVVTAGDDGGAVLGIDHPIGTKRRWRDRRRGRCARPHHVTLARGDAAGVPGMDRRQDRFPPGRGSKGADVHSIVVEVVGELRVVMGIDRQDVAVQQFQDLSLSLLMWTPLQGDPGWAVPRVGDCATVSARCGGNRALERR